MPLSLPLGVMEYNHLFLLVTWYVNRSLFLCHNIPLHLPFLVLGCYWIFLLMSWHAISVKPVLSGYSQKDQQWIFKTNYRLLQINRIEECSKGSILQYLRPIFEWMLKTDLTVSLFSWSQGVSLTLPLDFMVCY